MLDFALKTSFQIDEVTDGPFGLQQLVCLRFVLPNEEVFFLVSPHVLTLELLSDGMPVGYQPCKFVLYNR